MLSLKKVYGDELLQIALILSLLRVNQNTIYENDLFNRVLDFDNGTSWRSISPSVLRSHVVNPKSLDSVLQNYEREIFADLNSLGRFNRINYRHPDVTAYLLNIERNAAPLNNNNNNNPDGPPTSPQNQTDAATNSTDDQESTSSVDLGIELSQEDMDLIEVLWKQDVDLGFSIDSINVKTEDRKVGILKSEDEDASTSLNDDETYEKGKTLQTADGIRIKEEPEPEIQEEDLWAGFNYTIDTETGEYVIKQETNEDCGAESGTSCDSLDDLSLPLPEFLLDEALNLIDLDDEPGEEQAADPKDIEAASVENESVTDQQSEVTLTDPLEGAEPVVSKEIDEELNFLNDMIQTPQFHHPHHRASFQSRMPFVRTVSMEQRWQDLANLLSLPNPGDASGLHHHHHHPFSHHHHPLHNYTHPHSMGYSADAARGVLLHNATLNPPMGDLNASVPYSNLGGTNLGSAVATSMNLTNSSEPMGESSSAPQYKLEPSHDMMYYQNGSSAPELNQTDGFLSSILNDEDLQLMDMAMNEGMYTMRMLDANPISNLSMNGTSPSTNNMSRHDIERLDTSSDSAVSSMGSERVPSLSDGEWCDGGSDSGHTTNGEHYVRDYNKFRPYDYSYSSRQLNGSIGSPDASRLPPVAQKKHQMYGKRYFQDQGAASAVHQPHTPIKYEYRDAATASYNSPSQPEGAVGPKIAEMKYSSQMDFNRHPIVRNNIDHIQHNHSYHLPAENSGVMQRPISRDKTKSRKTSEEEHLTRDEKRARALNVPITVDDIINLPMDEFNERLSKYDLSEAQLSLIRDIRRRGKNKVAAQNCRKRKLDQILSLADEVKEMRDRKLRLMNDHEFAVTECKRMKEKYQQLYRHVFQNLRDPDGNQYSPYQYSLQTSADGSILMVPRSNTTLNNERKDPPQSSKD